MKKYVILFGTLFSGVWVVRRDSNGKVKQSFKVPLSYGPREKLLARIDGIDQDKDPLQQPFAITLPRMGFEITGFSYASERKLPTIRKFVESTTGDNTKKQFQYNPVPYDISFSLSIFVKNMEDGTQIIEQILPYFTPEWTTTVQLVSNPDITLDIPLVINDMNQDDVYEGSFEERRALIFTLNFTMKGYFFSPTKKKGIITLANTQFFDATLFDDIQTAVGQTSVIDRVTVTPGLTANGEPTTNADLTVDRSEIAANDNYDYIVDISGPLFPEE